mmetsp:Transcript_32310/g.78459  ORF Transcript_32310/g.78459 Transcript_32310/m.78459 type:complete len:207 (+) Transcript_32310:1231-1851(+)
MSIWSSVGVFGAMWSTTMLSTSECQPVSPEGRRFVSFPSPPRYGEVHGETSWLPSAGAAWGAFRCRNSSMSCRAVLSTCSCEAYVSALKLSCAYTPRGFALPQPGATSGVPAATFSSACGGRGLIGVTMGDARGDSRITSIGSTGIELARGLVTGVAATTTHAMVREDGVERRCEGGRVRGRLGREGRLWQPRRGEVRAGRSSGRE